MFYIFIWQLVFAHSDREPSKTPTPVLALKEGAFVEKPLIPNPSYNYVHLGLLLGHRAYIWGGWGKRYRNGSNLTFWTGHIYRRFGVCYHLPPTESDLSRHFLYYGSTFGFFKEWNLGNGPTCLVDVGGPCHYARVGLIFYPVEGLTISLAVYPVQRDWECNVTLFSAMPP